MVVRCPVLVMGGGCLVFSVKGRKEGVRRFGNRCEIP